MTVVDVGGYGYATALSADHAVIGSETERVHVFYRRDPGTPSNRADDTWVHQAELLSADQPVFYQGFGRALAIDGDWILVGSPYDDGLCTDDHQCNSGAAYVFLRDDQGTPTVPDDDTWSRMARLLPPDRAEDDYFGVSVALQGDIAVIGSYLNDDACVNDRYCDSGSVYVYRRADIGVANDPKDDVWLFAAKLTASDAAPRANFGWRVAIDGDWLAVNAIQEAGGGAVYLFRRSGTGSTWIEHAKIDAPAEHESWRFGGGMALEGDYLAVGAADTWINNLQSVGDAYVYHRNDGGTPNDPTDDAWVQQTRLTAVVPDDHDYFGAAVALDGNRMVVGASGDDGTCAPYYCGYGSIHTFTRHDGGTPDDHSDDTWVLERELNARRPIFDGRFGVALSMADNRLLVGARNGRGGPIPPGQAYVFTDDVDCNGNGAADACDLLKQVSADCNLNNTPDECDIAAGLFSDCNNNLAIDYCEVGDGRAVDCNRNFVPDECDLADPVRFDCNGNGTIDWCEVTPGSPDDCNRNHRPDECELADGAETDCDANGLLDVCDIAADPDLDCNRNELLDRCTDLEPDCNANTKPDDCERAALVQRFEQPQTYFASGYYGVLLATDAEHLVMGNPRENGTENELGAVRVYRRADGTTPLDPMDDQWNYITTLLPADVEPNGGYGEAVDIDGKVIVVGAMRANTPSIPDVGVAYVFEYSDHGTPADPADDTWIEKAKLIATDAAYRAAFGSVVAVHRHRIVIGAPDDGDAGSVYVFERDDVASQAPDGGIWIEVAKIEGNVAGQRFGTAVELRDDTIVVAAEFEPNSSHSGAVYVFTPTGDGLAGASTPAVWMERARLTPPVPNPGSRFGVSLSISGKRLVVGEEAGEGVFAHVFRRDDNGTPHNPGDDVWTHEAALLASQQYDDTRLSVSVDGDRLTVGGFATRYTYYNEGFSLVYRLTDGGTPFALSDDLWKLEAELFGPTPEDLSYFGASVALSDGNAIVRAGTSYGEQITGYAYGLTNDDCNANLVPDDCDLASATSLDENHNAVPDECERMEVLLGCLGGPAEVPGTFWNRNANDCRRAFDRNADGFVDLRDWSRAITEFGN